MARKRIEDLGRLAEMLNTILDQELFRKTQVHDTRFIQDMLSADNAEQVFHNIENVREMLTEAWCTARWGDDCKD